MAKAKSNGTTAMVPTPAAIGELVDPNAAAAFVRPITAESLKGVVIERLVSLEPMTMISGTYRGEGPVVEVTDPVTGEVRELKTHRFEVAPNTVLRVIDCHQLRRELPQHNGKRVRVMKLGQVNTRKGTRVNDFIVAPEVA